MIDVHEDTEMRCMVGSNGEIELRLGADAYLFLTESGKAKLVHTLSATQPYLG